MVLNLSLEHRSHVEVLDISGSHLKSLPDELALFPNLEWLDASSCGAESVSPKLNALQHLKILNLSDNHLQGVPLFVRSLSALQRLSFTGNPGSVQKEDLLLSMKNFSFQSDKVADFEKTLPVETGSHLKSTYCSQNKSLQNQGWDGLQGLLSDWQDHATLIGEEANKNPGAYSSANFTAVWDGKGLIHHFQTAIENSHDLSSFLFICDERGELRAFGYAEPEPKKGEPMELNLLVSSPYNLSLPLNPSPQKGAGRALIRQAIFHSLQKGGGGEVHLFALQGAIPFYLHLGFSPTYSGASTLWLEKTAILKTFPEFVPFISLS